MTALHIAGVYQEATAALEKYGNSLTAQAEGQKEMMRLADEVTEREIAVKVELMADNQGEIPGSNADKRRAAVEAAEQADEKLVKARELLAAVERDAYVVDAHVLGSLGV
jgi:hypothetical protein